MEERIHYRNPFNAGHFTAALFASRELMTKRMRTDGLQETLESRDRFTLPPGKAKELKSQAMLDSRVYQVALESIGGRIPSLGDDDFREVESGLRLDNVMVVGDTLQGSAQLAAFFYDKVVDRDPEKAAYLYDNVVDRDPQEAAFLYDKCVESGDPQSAAILYDTVAKSFDVPDEELKIKIQEGEGNLEESVLFLRQMKTVLPKMLDRKARQGNHPTLILKPEEIVALSILSLVPTNAPGAAEMREDAYQILETKNQHGLRLYSENSDLFEPPNQPFFDPYYTGQYL